MSMIEKDDKFIDQTRSKRNKKEKKGYKELDFSMYEDMFA